MRINSRMQGMINELEQIEGGAIASLLDLPANDLGNKLIKLYYKRENLKTRELIRDFMSAAGVVWLRKLLTKDTAPISSSVAPFASLDEYISLVAANDDVEGLVCNA